MNGLRIILSLLTAAVLFGAVLWIFDVHPGTVWSLVRTCSPLLLAGAFVAYSASYLGRALRFRLLLQDKAPPLPGLVCTVTLHNFFNAILPARTGELSYVVLLRKRFNLSSADGVASLVVARVLDLLCLLFFLGVGFVYYSGQFEQITPGLIALLAALFAAAILLLLNLPSLAALGLNWMVRLFALCGWNEARIPAWINRKGTETVEAFSAIGSRTLLLGAFGVSLCIWFFTYLTCYWILQSFGLPEAEAITFGLSILGTTALHATCILPINSFGNLGTWEAGWAAGYIFLGMNEKAAVQTGMGEHLIIFSFLLILGMVGWLGLHWISSPKKRI